MTEQEWLTSEDPAAMLDFVRGGRDHRDRAKYGFPISDRKLRLFACACYRQWLQFQHWFDSPSQYAFIVEASERYADGLPLGKWNGSYDVAMMASELGVYCGRSTGVEAASDTIRYTNFPCEAKVHLLRDIFGNPFQPVTIYNECQNCQGHGLLDPQTGKGATEGVACIFCRGFGRSCPYLSPQILLLAQAAYDNPGSFCQKCHSVGWTVAGHATRVIRQVPCQDCGGKGKLSDGILNPIRLAVLSDALEEAGCDSEELLRHLRGERFLGDGYFLTGDPPITSKDGWFPLPGPHVRGCWVVDLLLGKE